MAPHGRSKDSSRFIYRRMGGSLLIAIGLLITAVDARAQLCPGTTLISGLRGPMGLALSNDGNLIVSETGTPVPQSGRISILDPLGNRRTLLNGLPSGINDVNEPSAQRGSRCVAARSMYSSE